MLAMLLAHRQISFRAGPDELARHQLLNYLVYAVTHNQLGEKRALLYNGSCLLSLTFEWISIALLVKHTIGLTANFFHFWGRKILFHH